MRGIWRVRSVKTASKQYLRSRTTRENWVHYVYNHPLCFIRQYVELPEKKDEHENTLRSC